MINFLRCIALFLTLLPASALSEPPILVGVLLPLTGEVADYGAKLRKGIEQTNRAGVKFIYEDDACQSAKGLAGYHNLRRQGIKYFLGPCCGSPMKTVAPNFAEAEQLSFATCPISAAAYETSKGRVLLPQYSVEDESTFNAHEIHLRGFKRIVLLFQDTELARAHEKVFRDKFRGTIVDGLIYNTANAMELRPLMLKLKQLNYDALYIPHVEPLLLGVLREMAKIGIRGKPVFSVYSAQMPEVISINGEAAEGLLYSYPDIPLEEDAISFFPKLGSEMLAQALSECSGEYGCVKDYLRSHFKFSDTGVLLRKIVLRTIGDGKFGLTQMKPIKICGKGEECPN
jgi:ABC-type branched-subunit amino acid transport system substrate-binding protein